MGWGEGVIGEGGGGVRCVPNLFLNMYVKVHF